MKKIVVTGGTGRFGRILKDYKTKYKIFFPTKSKLDIKKYKSIDKYIRKTKPDYFIHCAAISRPMEIHDKNIYQSIDTNIIGTCNVVKVCKKYKTKLIYFSTNYVYPKLKGSYSETDPIFPFNNYGWSKLGGEAAVQMYTNSLILRICMTEKPFIHKKAFYNVKSNFIFHEDVAQILFKVLKFKGILNVGGPAQSVFNFAKKHNSKVKKIKCNLGNIPLNSMMNNNKLKKKMKNW